MLDSTWNSSQSQVCSSDFPISFSKPQYQSSTINDSATLIIILLNLMICPIAVTLNTALLIVMIRNPRLLSLNTISIFFLSVADLLVSAFGQISFIANELSIFIHGRLQCSATFATNLYAELLTIGLSFFTLKAMTLERFLAIFCPYWFHKYATKRTVCFGYGLTWVFWISYITIVRFSPGIPESTYTSVLSAFIFINLLFTLSVYFKIDKLRKQAQPVAPEYQLNTAENIAQRKTSRTVVYINAALFMSYFPSFLVGILHYTRIVTNDVLIYHVLYPLAQTAGFNSAAVDPLIYAWRNSEIRESFRRLIGKKVMTTQTGSNSDQSGQSRETGTGQEREGEGRVGESRAGQGRMGGAYYE